MPLPPNLTKFTTTSPVLASFSFSEFASGLGFVNFFFCGTTDSVGAGYILTERALLARPVLVLTTTGMDVDFDLSPFNRSIRLKGTASINLTTNFNVPGGTHNWNYVITIRKWDGTTETDIATVTTDTVSVSASSNGEVTQLTQLEIPETNFSTGDILRVNIDAVSTGGPFNLHIDPADRGGINANSLINIPFLIDL